ncbi:electron transport complex subunit RsxC, partial [Salmonella enterica subsp. enterica serovar Infantis]
AAREARKEKARAKQAALPMADSALPGDDPRYGAVEAAIARAKARKQEQQAGREPDDTVVARKAEVESAIARAQASNQEQQ